MLELGKQNIFPESWVSIEAKWTKATPILNFFLFTKVYKNFLIDKKKLTFVIG